MALGSLGHFSGPQCLHLSSQAGLLQVFGTLPPCRVNLVPHGLLSSYIVLVYSGCSIHSFDMKTAMTQLQKVYELYISQSLVFYHKRQLWLWLIRAKSNF